ncbi:hypothetical protein [Lederbergia citrea]|uniref:hypothetical protein n=1 Tax=Lederbergia citrea TaxID=2833581 RepID=UPI001BC8CF07|nr:hypothetical protein [Lederbergia citrea]MBS4205691.1 hypothetical protein [Lederbergia citrea]
MSLIEMSLSDVVKKQFSFKLKAYLGVFSSLMFMQILAIFFSLLGTMSTYHGSSIVSVNFSYFSADTVIVFTMLWGFMSAILITTKATRYDDFAFVANRVSNNVSNTLFLVAASAIGGITSMLSSYLIKLIVYFIKDIQYGANMTPKELLIGFAAASLYVLLFSALGYLVGIFIQMSKVFVILLPALLVGSFVVSAVGDNGDWLLAIFNFFVAESSLLIFFIKNIVLSGLLFSFSTVLSNRLEVRN